MSSVFTIEDRPIGTKQGSVITTDLLNDLTEAVKDLTAGKEIVLSGLPRKTKGSAASFAYQIKRALQARDVVVHGGARAANQGQATDVAPWFAAISK